MKSAKENMHMSPKKKNTHTHFLISLSLLTLLLLTGVALLVAATATEGDRARDPTAIVSGGGGLRGICKYNALEPAAQSIG